MFNFSKEQRFYYFLFFFMIYSFLGWCLETVVVFITTGNVESRGLIFGPFCIIYGFGIILIITILDPIKEKLLKFFISSVILISILEYSTGFFLELFFKRRWWDYSNLPLNVHGYICLTISIIWGILAIVILKFVHPLICELIERIPKNKAERYSHIIFAFFIINICTSLIHISNLRK